MKLMWLDRIRALRFSMVVLAALLAGCEQPAEPVGAGTVEPKVATGQGKKARIDPADGETLKAELDEVIAFTVQRRLDPKVNAAWQIVHGILAFGNDLKLKHDGKLVGALDYVMQGGELRGWELRPGDRGLEAILDPGSKTGMGHEDQWLGYFSQCGVQLDDEILVRGQPFTVRDLLTQAQWDVREDMELTWTLMAASKYLTWDATWKTRDGGDWSVERLCEIEARQSLPESACGGSHRMYALAKARNNCPFDQKDLKGGWLAADKKIRDAVVTIQNYQQPDGSFSTDYFDRPATSPDMGLQISTTGHSLEFLVVALPKDRLHERWVTMGVIRLCELLRLTRDLDLECGGIYHAAHALKLYREYRFGPVERASSAGE